MNNRHSFFSLAELKQPVNQWLCIAFLGLWCFWTLLYFFINKAEAIVNVYNTSRAAALK